MRFLNPDVVSSLVPKVREFIQDWLGTEAIPRVLSDELFTDIDPYDDVLFIKKMLTPWKSTCRVMTCFYMLFTKYMLDRKKHSQDAFNAAAINFKLPHQVIKKIKKCESNSIKRWCIIPTHVEYFRKKKARAHACVLMFDLKNKIQYFFDPWGFAKHEKQRTVSLLEAVCSRPAFVQGYTVPDILEQGWLRKERGLQTVFERIYTDSSDKFKVAKFTGVCVLMCILVIMVLVRFNIHTPLQTADVLKHMVKHISVEDREQIVLRLAVFILRMARIPYSRTGEFFVPTTPGIHTCNTLLLSGKLCSRNTCENRCMCWQHENMLLNPDKETKGC